MSDKWFYSLRMIRLKPDKVVNGKAVGELFVNSHYTAHTLVTGITTMKLRFKYKYLRTVALMYARPLCPPQQSGVNMSQSERDVEMERFAFQFPEAWQDMPGSVFRLSWRWRLDIPKRKRVQAASPSCATGRSSWLRLGVYSVP